MISKYKYIIHQLPNVLILGLYSFPSFIHTIMCGNHKITFFSLTTGHRLVVYEHNIKVSTRKKQAQENDQHEQY